MRKFLFSALEIVRRSLYATGIKKLIKKSPVAPLAIAAYRLLYQGLKPKGTMMVSIQGSKMFIDPRPLSFSHDLLVRRVWEPYQTDLFKSLVRNGMVVVDIGAHIGYYTLLAARLVGPEGKVFAFEPAPDNLALLVRNIEVNRYSNVIAVQKAVSNKSGITKLFLSPEHTGAHRIYNSDDVRKLPDCIEVLIDKQPHFLTSPIEVETVTLDEFFPNEGTRIDVVKMDVEGAEILVLQGMSKMLQTHDTSVLFTEFWPVALRDSGHLPEEYLNKLREYGFSIYYINEERGKLESVHTNNFTHISAREDSMNLLCVRAGVHIPAAYTSIC